jgi:DNA-binding transcriptional MerR regulator
MNSPTMTTTIKTYAEIVDEYRLQPKLVNRWVEMQLLPRRALSDGFGSLDELRLKFVMRALEFGFSLREIKVLMERAALCMAH